ncbi:MAG: phosphotransferase [Pseudomonadota bacterium]
MTDLAALAPEAAAHWRGTPLRLINARENAVFEMALPDGGRAALRLHRMGYQSDAAIRSELWWTAALAAQGVPVPEPLATANGDLLVRLGTGRMASAVRWLSGEPLGVSLQPFDLPTDRLVRLHHALGQMLARLHDATDALVLPDDFIRPRWDVPGLVGEAPFWGRFWDHPAADAAQRQTLLAARDFLTTWLSRQTDTPGPIHADVLRENVLVDGDRLSLIDFDDSGIGFRHHDLGTALIYSVCEPAYPAIRDALLAGYAQTRLATVEAIELFALARACASVGWTMPRLAADDPIHRSHIARAVMWADVVMRRYM